MAKSLPFVFTSGVGFAPSANQHKAAEAREMVCWNPGEFLFPRATDHREQHPSDAQSLSSVWLLVHSSIPPSYKYRKIAYYNWKEYLTVFFFPASWQLVIGLKFTARTGSVIYHNKLERFLVPYFLLFHRSRSPEQWECFHSYHAVWI